MSLLSVNIRCSGYWQTENCSISPTDSYLMSGEDHPTRTSAESPSMFCPNLQHIRRQYFTASSLQDIFTASTIKISLTVYSASALLAMHSAVLARGIPSVCPPSVRPTHSGIVSRWMKIRSCGFLVSGRTIPLVSEDANLSGYLQGNTSSGGVKVRHPFIDSENSTNNRP